jgi:hypothetical protein
LSIHTIRLPRFSRPMHKIARLEHIAFSGVMVRKKVRSPSSRLRRILNGLKIAGMLADEAFVAGGFAGIA